MLHRALRASQRFYHAYFQLVVRISSTSVVMILVIAFAYTVQAQTVPLGFLEQVATTYPLIAAVHSLATSGTATWTAGSLKESGTVTLQAANDGSGSIQLNLEQASRTESQAAFGVARTCQWTDRNGQSHAKPLPDCVSALPWFAPIFLLQTLPTSANSTAFSDDGVVVRQGVKFYEISYLTTIQAPNSKISSRLTSDTRVNVYCDPQTLLPTILEYKIHADADLNTTLAVRMEYSDYQAVAGIPFPRQIKRFVNNTLQLDIALGEPTLKQ